MLDHSLRAGHSDHAVLQRLAQGIEHRGRELSELVEEQHTSGGCADLARSGPGAAPTHQGGHRRRMVGRPERRTGDQAVGQRQTGGRVDPGYLQSLGGRQVRQQAHETAGQHGLARAGRSDQQQVMPAGRGDLQRPSSQRLARDVAQVWLSFDRGRSPGRRRIGPGRGAGQGFEHLGEPAHRPHPLRRHQLRHGAVSGRHHDRVVVHGIDEGQRAGNGAHRAVESQLPQRADVFDRRRLELPVGHQHADGNGQVETGARLGHVAGGQVDGYALRRPRELAGHDGGPNPVAGLPARGVGQSDDGEGGQPGGHMDLHRYGVAPHADEGGGADGSEHWRPPWCEIRGRRSGGRRQLGRRLTVQQAYAAYYYSTSRVYLTTAAICSASSASAKPGMDRTPSATMANWS